MIKEREDLEGYEAGYYDGYDACQKHATRIWAVVLLVWLGFFFFGCGAQNDRYKPYVSTPRGLLVRDVFNRDNTPEIVDTTVQVISALTGVPEEEFAGWQIDIVDEQLWSDRGFQANGLTYAEQNFMKVKATNHSGHVICLAETALAHELTHAIQYEGAYTIDYEHEDPFYWGSGGVSAEATRVTSLIFCLED